LQYSLFLLYSSLHGSSVSYCCVNVNASDVFQDRMLVAKPDLIEAKPVIYVEQNKQITTFSLQFAKNS